MRVHELRTDVIYIVRHASQDGVGDRFGAIAALLLVAVKFLDPFQVDHWHHTHQQVRMLSDVDFGSDNRAVQAFVKQQVGAGWNDFPGGKGAGLLLVGGCLFGVVQVLAPLSGTGAGVVAKQRFDFREQVVLRTEVAEILVALLLGFGQSDLHFLAVETVEAVTFDDGGFDALATENLAEGASHRGGTSAAGAGDGDDGVAFRHGVSPKIY